MTGVDLLEQYRYRGFSGGQPLQASSGGQLLFTATSTTHRVAVLSCDRGFDAGSSFAGRPPRLFTRAARRSP